MKQKLLPKAPKRLIEHGEIAPFGRYLGGVEDVDTSFFDKTRISRRLKRKAWIYGGLYNDAVMCGIAIVDAGLLATGFAYVFDRARGVFFEEKIQIPWGFSRDFHPSLNERWMLGRGKNLWMFEPQRRGFQMRTELRAGRIALQVDLSGVEPVSTIAPAKGRPFSYTLKAVGGRASMTWDINHKGLRTHGETHGPGVVDFTLGYPARHTFWNWACFAGKTAKGKSFGLNLVADHNNGFENCMWVDGKAHPLAQAVFQYDHPIAKRPWHITTLDAQFDVTFSPEGSRAEDIRLGLMHSTFSQPFGRFTGTIVENGRNVAVSGYGVVEEHDAVW